MGLEEVKNSIRNIKGKTAGKSIRIKIAAYNLLKYIQKNKSYDVLIDSLKAYYVNEYDGDEKHSGLYEFATIINQCDKIIIDNDYEDIYLEDLHYTNKDIEKYIDFIIEFNNLTGNELLIGQRILIEYINNLKKDVELASKNYNNLNKELEHTKEISSNYISNLLFSIASLFVGISLVSSMVSGMSNIKSNHILLYFLAMGWIATFVIGLASIFIRDKNNKTIIVLIIIYTIVLLVTSLLTLL